MVFGSLYDYLRNPDSIYTPSFCLSVAIQMTEGLHYLHQVNILHNDLKSLNILISGDGAAKISDFGQSTTGKKSLHRGTTIWQAPEVLKSEYYTQASDVFSLGRIYLELLTRHKPFANIELSGEKLKQYIINNLHEHIPWNAHQDIITIINKCLAIKPFLRPSTAELRRSLTAFSENKQLFFFPVGAVSDERKSLINDERQTALRP